MLADGVTTILRWTSAQPTAAGRGLLDDVRVVDVNEKGLLAHLATSRFSGMAETIATESLVYLLQTYSAAADGFQGLCQRLVPDLAQVTTYSGQSHSDNDSGIPDIEGHGEDGATRVIVEAKFWAGLTAHQPVTYLERLDSKAPSLLLFVVPTRREQPVWQKLVERTAEAGFTGLSDHRTLLWTSNERTMAVVSWDQVVSSLRHELQSPRNDAGLADLLQLEGLCAYQDETQFIPLSSEELTGSIGRRIGDLVSLVSDLGERLRTEGMASMQGLAKSASQDYIGRYASLKGWEVLLHLNWGRWSSQYPTPIWLQITDRRARTNVEMCAALDAMVADQDIEIFIDESAIQFPIPIPFGSERDEVLDAAVDRVRRIYLQIPVGPHPTESSDGLLVSGVDSSLAPEM